MEKTDKMSLTIEVGNVFSKAKTGSSRIMSALYDGMSCLCDGYYFSPAYKSGRWDGKTHFFNRSSGKFPTGMLHKALEILEPFELNIKLNDTREGSRLGEYAQSDDESDLPWGPSQVQLPLTTFEEITLPGGKQLRDYQVDAVNKVINHYEYGMLFQRGIINIATNGGKTVIAEAIINHLLPYLTGDRVFLFVTHSKEIAHQAIQSFENDLGIKVGLVGDGKVNIQPVTVAMVSTLYSRMNRKHEMFQELTCRTIGFIGDEIHHSSSNSWYEVLTKFENAYIRLGLTGTVQKVEEKRMRLYAACGNILVKISNDFLIQHEYSAKPKCFIVPIDYPDIDRTMRYYGQPDRTGMLEYPDVYLKGISANTYRNYIIALICNKEVTQNKGQVLVLVEHVEHGANIQAMIEEVNPELQAVFLHGSLSSQERQTGLDLLKSGDVDVVISTSILDEGVDVPNINALIYARGGKSIRKVLQGIGRGLRKKEDGSQLHFYDFLDDTSEFLVKHTSSRYDTLKKEKFETVMVDLEKDLGFGMEQRIWFMENLDDAFDDDVFQRVSTD
ncbi:MAG: DEAD/DEAH box helicase [Lachnospiraceae bacterium]|nr:DEAD/DEAH box helicase [Lachnospiraceae bacterium]